MKDALTQRSELKPKANIELVIEGPVGSDVAQIAIEVVQLKIHGWILVGS